MGVGWGSLIWGLFNGLFWAGSWVLRGLIWFLGEMANLRLLEGLELIFEYGMDGGWLGGGGEKRDTVHAERRNKVW